MQDQVTWNVTCIQQLRSAMRSYQKRGWFMGVPYDYNPVCHDLHWFPWFTDFSWLASDPFDLQTNKTNSKLADLLHFPWRQMNEGPSSLVVKPNPPTLRFTSCQVRLIQTFSAKAIFHSANLYYSVVSTHLKNISQTGSFPQIDIINTDVWYHHLVIHGNSLLLVEHWRSSLARLTAIKYLTFTKRLSYGSPRIQRSTWKIPIKKGASCSFRKIYQKVKITSEIINNNNTHGHFISKLSWQFLNLQKPHLTKKEHLRTVCPTTCVQKLPVFGPCASRCKRSRKLGLGYPGLVPNLRTTGKLVGKYTIPVPWLPWELQNSSGCLTKKTL